ncbi:MAG TPA: cupredoxin family protein [Burkholderiales bacterium]|nr:cupredoxin family protein [Burkholderiales bacterium]
MKQLLFLLLFLATVPFVAYGHGESHAKRQAPKRGAPVEEKAFGREGDPSQVTRTVRIVGTDDMRYTPAAIRVRQGETVKFVVHNRGKLLHETVLGTMPELEEHYELMKKFPDMEHDEPHMVHLKPGKTGEMVWQFTKAGEFYFGCLMPGHLEAGMMGRITVVAN